MKKMMMTMAALAATIAMVIGLAGPGQAATPPRAVLAPAPAAAPATFTAPAVVVAPNLQVGFGGGKFWAKINRLDLATGVAAGITSMCTAAFGLPGLFTCGSILTFARSQLYANRNASGVWVEISLKGFRGGIW